ncbi:MAG: hypothetical protein ACRDPJ_19945 [Nocardioidaceae bacterium]
MSRARKGILGAVLAAALLTACSGQAAQESAGSGPAPSETTTSPSGAASREHPTVARVASRGESSPSLPPGDPGPDAPSVPDPGPAKGHGHADPPRRTVPRAALLDRPTLSAMLRGTWREAGTRALPCTAAPDTVASRTVAFRSSSGQVVQTVSTHMNVSAADRAVRRLANQLAACGWDLGSDPRLGTASLSAADGHHTLTVVSVEGVSLVLAGNNSVAADEGRWASLVDVALGSVCPAAPDGCH